MAKTENILNRMEQLKQETGVCRTLFAACPNSLAVIKASFRSAKRNNAPIYFATTLNQVDCDGGYTGMTQAEFTKVLAREAAAVNYTGPYVVAVDHGGPWLKDKQTLERWDTERAMQGVKESYEASILAGYDLIHVDPTVDIFLPKGEIIDIHVVVKRTIELILHAENFRKAHNIAPISYEVGTEEVHGGLADETTFDTFLTELKAGLKAVGLEDIWPCFIVGKVGTDLHTTFFDPEVAKSLTAKVRPYGSWIKGHYSDDNMLTYISLSSQAESVVAADGDALTVSYHTLVSWGEGGVKILLDMPVANSFSFRLQGDGSSYAVRVYVEQNGSDWWYKNLYPGAEAEAFTLDVSNLKKLSWHNNLADESFSGENVTAIYFVASNADETTTGTFTVSGLEVAGEIAASDDYAETVILRSETDYPASLEEGTEIYRGTEASCTDELTPGTTYYYSAFAIDETGNVAEAAHFTFTLPEEPVALDNTEAAAPSKLMIGGHLYILRDGRAYSATGVRMY